MDLHYELYWKQVLDIFLYSMVSYKHYIDVFKHEEKYSNENPQKQYFSEKIALLTDISK